MHDIRGGGEPRRGLRRLLPPVDASHRVSRVTSARVLAAVFDVAVGVRLLWPDHILDNPANPNYELLGRHFGGDLSLGLVLLACGGLMTASLYTDNWHRPVTVAHWASMLVWIIVAFDISWIGLSQLGTLVYLLVAALNAWAYFHLAEWREQQRRDARARKATT